MDGSRPWSDVRAGVLAALPCAALLRPDHAVATTSPDEPLAAAVHRMWWRQMGALPVVEDGRLLGSFGEQALLRTTAARLDEQAGRSGGRSGLQVWEDLLGGVRVGDAMTPRAELPVLPARESLLAGLRLCSERTGVPTRYLFLTGEGGALAGILSLRDLARHLVELYDGTRALPADADPERARASLRHVLDLQLGEVRRTTTLGHEPVVVSDDLCGADAIRAVWQGGRGYVVAAFPDGAPKGIFTRRDLLRVLSRPFVDLEGARLANWMSHSVKTASELDTLYGLFKSMGMEGCRHMPVVDDWDRLECVISMWEALWLLASAD